MQGYRKLQNGHSRLQAKWYMFNTHLLCWGVYVNFVHVCPCTVQVHVNILALEARLQAELIYALRAIMMHMK